MQEKFENEGFTMKIHLMFSAHTTPQELKMQQSLVKENSVRDDHSDVIIFETFCLQINKLTSVFYASVLLLIINFVITLSK